MKIASSDNEASIHNSIDEDDGIESHNDIKSKIKFLPATIDGLGKCLVNCGKNSYEKANNKHWNEIVFILDESLCQDAITQNKYK